MPFEDTPSSSEAVARLKQRLSLLETEEGRMAGVNLQPRPDDVFIVTPPKCGTTWVQQIAHTLRSRGDMSFDEISLVIPCLEMAWDAGVRDLQAAQPGAPPRCYKTHFWHRDCPKGGKYIYVVRDPVDVGPSFYHFLEGWFFDRGEVHMDEYLREFWLARGAPATPMQNASHWHNVVSWYEHRHSPDVLWLHYEDLVEDIEAAVKLIATFMPGVDEGDEELLRLAVQQSDIKFMKQHATKYDEHPLKLARNEACGRPRLAGLSAGDSGKVRGLPKEKPSPELLAAIQARWEEVVLPATGYRSYGDMRRGINRELGRPFASANGGSAGIGGAGGGNGGEAGPGDKEPVDGSHV